ncbi:DNA-directed RNA polymerase specialized sigma subunit [Paenibacillus sp. DS2363]
MGAVMVQMELIPSADDKDINRVVDLLTVDYHQWRATLKVLDKLEGLTAEQASKQAAYSIQVSAVETAINAILDKEARDIIQHKYVNSTRRKYTVARFRNEGLSESTVDRRIKKGLKSIANTLKDCGMLWPS